MHRIRQINPLHLPGVRLRLILGNLNAYTSPADMNLPGLYLHQLTANRKETWSVRVGATGALPFNSTGTCGGCRLRRLPPRQNHAYAQPSPSW